jgi:hypothetical protein
MLIIENARSPLSSRLDPDQYERQPCTRYDHGSNADAVSGTGVAGATVSYNFGLATTDANGNYCAHGSSSRRAPGDDFRSGICELHPVAAVSPNQTATLNISLVRRNFGIVTSLETGNPIAGAEITYNGGSIIAGADGLRSGTLSDFRRSSPQRSASITSSRR